MVAPAGILVFVARRAAFFEQVLTSRLSTEGRGSSTHFLVYDFTSVTDFSLRSLVSSPLPFGPPECTSTRPTSSAGAAA